MVTALRTRRAAPARTPDTRWRDNLRGTLLQRHFQGA
jgi:hypothetical protein